MNSIACQQPPEVLVAGAGPVGLLLGCQLARLGLRFRIYEARESPRRHSRSIGLHPPSLECLDRLSLLPRFLERGLKVERGMACTKQRMLGELDFSRCPGPCPFVLTLPQTETEAMLEAHLTRVCPGAVCRGTTLEQVEEREGGLTVLARRLDGTPLRDRCQYLVGCDGLGSRVRELAGLAFPGGPYPVGFMMGDFAEATDWGPVARIYLPAQGLVEAFPLPAAQRRWVLNLAAGEGDISAVEFCRRIHQRTGCDLAESACLMMNGFQARRHLAAGFYRRRLVLVGDAAHVMSPFGGQGMNVGWLNAMDLGATLFQILRRGAEANAALHRFEGCARQRAVRAIRRAEINLRFGLWTAHPVWRQRVVWLLLRPPFRGRLARVFTMRGL